MTSGGAGQQGCREQNKKRIRLELCRCFRNDPKYSYCDCVTELRRYWAPNTQALWLVRFADGCSVGRGPTTLCVGSSRKQLVTHCNRSSSGKEMANETRQRRNDAQGRYFCFAKRITNKQIKNGITVRCWEREKKKREGKRSGTGRGRKGLDRKGRFRGDFSGG